MAVILGLDWHQGEEKMQNLLRVPNDDNPTAPMLTPQAILLLQSAPLLAVGTVDSQRRPWTTLWGGDPGFAAPLGSSTIGIRLPVDYKFDPVIQELFGSIADGRIVNDGAQGKMVGGLSIDLMRRKRVKLYGRMLAGALGGPQGASRLSDDGNGSATAELQLAVRIEQSLGNCPKYLNKKEIHTREPAPRLISSSAKLVEDAVALINKADLFFISSSHADIDMDTNHRGGPPGFVRVSSNDEGGAQIVYPEYSGNRLYQTLGNLQTTPLAGLVFPDFANGNVLYLTGTTKILIGKEARSVLPHSNLAVSITVTASRFVESALPFRGIPKEPSPYNPNVWRLAKERAVEQEPASSQETAKLVNVTNITPTINRYRFSITSPTMYKAGQWAAFDFSTELDIGYSHMRDDDPRSLNDDFIRTFTVSSPPHPDSGLDLHEFEITARTNGPVTSFLAQQNSRSGLEVPLRGFGGDFVIAATSHAEDVAFVAGGVGITPLLGQLPQMDLSKLHLFWTVRAEDVPLIIDTLTTWPALGPTLAAFITGSTNTRSLDALRSKLLETGGALELRRIEKDDVTRCDCATWYLCAGKQLRLAALRWLDGKQVLYEDFDY